MNISVQMFECCSGFMTAKENWSAGEQTRGIDVDQSGNVYVAIGGAIKKFDKEGNHLGTFFGYKEIDTSQRWFAHWCDSCCVKLCLKI